MADKSLRAVRPEHIETFKTARIASGVSAKTIDRDLKVVRAVFKAGIKQEHLNFDPSQTVSLVSRKSKAEDQTISREVFQPEELDAILDAAEDDWKTAILIARYTGARLGNCVGMYWRDFNFSTDVVRYIDIKPAGNTLYRFIAV